MVEAVPTIQRDEEAVNAVTHGVGFALAVAAAAVLIVAAARAGDAWQIVGCSVYAATLIGAYAASTLSHACRHPTTNCVMRAADQALIYLFIAGTWTPIAFTWLRGGTGWWVLHASIWAVAIAGFLSKAVFAHRVRQDAVGAGSYVLLGWLPMLSAYGLVQALPTGLLVWVVAGGLCYTAGIAFFQLDSRVRYFHAVWHLMVIAGSACHFFGILGYCTAAPV